MIAADLILAILLVGGSCAWGGSVGLVILVVLAAAIAIGAFFVSPNPRPVRIAIAIAGLALLTKILMPIT